MLIVITIFANADNTKLATWSGNFTVAGSALKQLKNRYVGPVATVTA